MSIITSVLRYIDIPQNRISSRHRRSLHHVSILRARRIDRGAAAVKMAVVLALVLLAATSRVSGRFYQSKSVGASDGDLLIVTGQVEIGILSGFSSTLRYLNGTCSWRITTLLAGNEIDQPLSVGPQITLDGGGGGSEGFTLKCVTEDGEQLNAIISTHGKEWIITLYHELRSVIQLRTLSHHHQVLLWIMRLGCCIGVIHFILNYQWTLI